jgi:hypothetical protein
MQEMTSISSRYCPSSRKYPRGRWGGVIDVREKAELPLHQVPAVRPACRLDEEILGVHLHREHVRQLAREFLEALVRTVLDEGGDVDRLVEEGADGLGERRADVLEQVVFGDADRGDEDGPQRRAGLGLRLARAPQVTVADSAGGERRGGQER